MHAQTLVGGRILSDSIWTLAGSPYIVTTSILVDSGVTLTIRPGAVVKFNKFNNIGTALQISGRLIARGKSDSLITFTSGQTSPAAGDWGYLFFNSSSANAQYDTGGNYVGGSILEYCTVNYAGGAAVTNNGAVRMDNAHPFISHTAIQYNSASGICGWNLTGRIKIDNSIISNDTSAEKGGGIYLSESGSSPTGTGSITIVNSIVHGNASSGPGGGVYAFAHDIVISNNVIDSNTSSGVASGDGGGIYASGNSATISNNSIRRNASNFTGTFTSGSFNGGGIFIASGAQGLFDGTGSLYNNLISGNSASGCGGGIYVADGDISVFKNLVTYNEDFDNVPNPPICGGGIRVTNGTVAISENTFAYNISHGHGGGIYVSGGTVTISKNAIGNNRAYLTGGGIGITGGTVSCSHNEIGNNVAQNGSAMSCSGSDSLNIGYNTISGNAATGTAPTATIYLVEHSHPMLNRNIISGNTATYELWNGNAQGTADINAVSNWWGTTNTSMIATGIYDYFDDPTKTIVNFSPFLGMPDTGAPVSPPSGIILVPGSGRAVLQWAPNPESDLAGYRIYYDTVQRYPYSFSKDVGNNIVDTISGLSAGTYYLAVTAYDRYRNGVGDQIEGHESWFSKSQSGTVTGVRELNKGALPNLSSLVQNYPNPFNPVTTFSFNLSTRSFVSLIVFDLRGREVATIVSGLYPAGDYFRQWDASNISSGVYFYRLLAGTLIETKKLVLLK